MLMVVRNPQKDSRGRGCSASNDKIFQTIGPQKRGVAELNRPTPWPVSQPPALYPPTPWPVKCMLAGPLQISEILVSTYIITGLRFRSGVLDSAQVSTG